ncbi:MAG: hypothetical protein N2Z22_02545, partial [Turneriella sp.]|nr:hypothetical protein [Turneriella sp.]
GKNNIPEPAGAIVHTVQGGVYSPLLAEIKGKKILIQPTLDTGIGLFVNYVLRSKVLLTLQFLDPLDEKNNPLEKTTLTFDSRESGIPGFAYGDFDGDGQTDFILGTEINGITIYGGNAQFEKKVIAQLTAPAYGIFKPVRNPDGTHSLFIYMTQRSKAPKKNAVYLVPIVLRKD